MPKRRRLFTPNKNKIKNAVRVETKSGLGKEVNTARGRLMGALMDVLDPTAGDDSSEESYEPTPSKQDRQSTEKREFLTDEEAKKCLRKSPTPQSYVLKLFDRSVDLSQFREDSPLYPICRAWILNQPKANYSSLGAKKDPVVLVPDEGVVLPGPVGEEVSRVPPLLPHQRRANKDNINLNYHEVPPPSKESLLRAHAARWAAVRRAWLDQAAIVEHRYEATQQILNKISLTTSYLEKPPVATIYEDLI